MRTKLYAVPARREPSLAETVPGSTDGVAVEPAWERLRTWARAVDDSAALAEDVIGALHGFRTELLAGREPNAQTLALSLIARLSGAAYVLGETQVGLEELAHEFDGGAA